MMESRGTLKPEDKEPNIAGLEYYLEAFKELSTSRPSSMGVSPIPFTAILEYFKVYPCGEFDEFLYLIRRMDDSLLKSYSDKNKPRGDNGKPSSTGNNKV